MLDSALRWRLMVSGRRSAHGDRIIPVPLTPARFTVFLVLAAPGLICHPWYLSSLAPDSAKALRSAAIESSLEPREQTITRAELISSILRPLRRQSLFQTITLQA